MSSRRQRHKSPATSRCRSQCYWQIGSQIRNKVLDGERAKYGKQVVKALADELTNAYGKGWGLRQLQYCIQMADAFPDLEIVNALRAQLSWTHLRSLVVIEDPIKRDFYTKMAKLEGWSTRQLTERIKSMMFERTAISKKPEQTIANDLQELRADGKLSADLAFRDPYVLDFLGLADSYSERDLESSILAELQRFIAEFGTDFAFVARQKRITIDKRDYYNSICPLNLASNSPIFKSITTRHLSRRWKNSKSR